MSINLSTALKLIDAARKKAEEIGVPMVIAVVDDGGNLVAQVRMDDALLVSVDIARNKAYTAAAVKVATHELGSVSQPNQPLFGIHVADGCRIVIFGGGFPLKKKDKVIGGIGVSGGSVEQDMECAQAALERL
ncbi:MAG: heme-binding protein [Deltaproteobacteria bacterium]|nr:heme-binding protein [Deltaproteobacteria bacterium]